MRFDRSVELSKRAHELIPGGAHTYAKGDDQYPESAPDSSHAGRVRTSGTSTATSSSSTAPACAP